MIVRTTNKEWFDFHSNLMRFNLFYKGKPIPKYVLFYKGYSSVEILFGRYPEIKKTER